MDKQRAAQGDGRLLWLDAARGLAMLLVIIGHTVPGNQALIGAAYTFHLPLFFVLSGYASRPVKSWNAYLSRHVKSFFQLIVPCIIVQMGLMLYLYLLEGAPGAARLIGLEKRAILQLFWAGAVEHNGRPMLGIPWFMFTLFWGRVFFDAIRLCTKKYAAVVCLAAAAAGLAIGSVTYLPQSLDLALVSLLYLGAGAQMRALDESGRTPGKGLLLAAALVWAAGIVLDIRTDMAVHQYGPYLLGVPVSLCACAVVFAGMKRLEKIKSATRMLAYVGRISLYVFFVHHVDDYFMGLWNRENWWLCIANRIVVVVLIAAAVHAVIQVLRRFVRRAKSLLTDAA